MKKVIVSMIVIGLLLMSSIASVNAFDMGELKGELENSGAPVTFPWTDEVWDVETVDSNGNVGRGTSLAIDSNGYPHICYYDRDHYYLKYVRFNGLEWEDPQIIGTYTTAFNSLALDSNDRPHIAYTARADDDYFSTYLKYIKWTGSEWEEHIVDTYGTDGQVGIYVSLVLDEYNNPHIGYTDVCVKDGWSVFYPKYAYLNDTMWQVEYVEETHECGSCCSIDVDSENVPHMVYVEHILHPNGQWYIGDILKYATRNSDGWLKENISDAWVLGDFSFSLDSNDDPHICYVVSCLEYPEHENQIYDEDLYYAHRINNNFESTIIDDSFGVLSDVSMAIDSYDNPHISYYHECFDQNQNELKYATIKEGLWRIELVESSNNSQFGRYNSIAIDGENTPHISFYFDYDVGGLMYATKIRDENPPIKPTIDGPVNVKVNEEQEYMFASSDPDSQNLYYYIEWGDYSIEEWIGPYSSGEAVIVNHTWTEKGTYNIKAKVRDIYGVESDWADPLQVAMPVVHEPEELTAKLAVSRTTITRSNCWVTFDASGSTPTTGNKEPVLIRWDIDGRGWTRWKSFSRNKKIENKDMSYLFNDGSTNNNNIPGLESDTIAGKYYYARVEIKNILSEVSRDSKLIYVDYISNDDNNDNNDILEETIVEEQLETTDEQTNTNENENTLVETIITTLTEPITPEVPNEPVTPAEPINPVDPDPADPIGPSTGSISNLQRLGR